MLQIRVSRCEEQADGGSSIFSNNIFLLFRFAFSKLYSQYLYYNVD